MNPGQRSNVMMLVAAGVLWGSSFTAAKVGVEHLDPIFFSLYRYLFAALAISLFLLAIKQFDLSVFRNKMLWALAGINSLAMVLQNVGMTKTSATNTVLLVDINVVYIAILAVFVLRERLTRKMLVGLLVGLVGVVIISTEGDLSSIGGGSFEGNMFAFGAGLLWTFYVVYLTRELNGSEKLIPATGAIIIESALLLIPLTLLTTSDYHIDMTGSIMAAYVGIMCTAVAFIFYSYGLKYLGATRTSIIMLIEIVFGMLFAILLLAEMPTVATAIGSLFILIAVIIIEVRPAGQAPS